MVQVVNKKPVFSSTLYNILKTLVQVVAPAAAALYVALAATWGLPDVSSVVGSITAVTAFFGVTLHLSAANYVSSGAAYNGTISLSPTATGSSLSMHIDPADVVGKDVISLQVVPPKLSVVPEQPPSAPQNPGVAPPSSP